MSEEEQHKLYVDKLLLANTLKTLNYIKSSEKLDQEGKTCVPAAGSAALEATQRQI